MIEYMKVKLSSAMAVIGLALMAGGAICSLLLFAHPAVKTAIIEVVPDHALYVLSSMGFGAGLALTVSAMFVESLEYRAVAETGA